MFNFINILWAPRSSETPFAIQKLPDLALKEVIRSMDFDEQIRLSLTSKKSARNVKQLGISCSSFKLYLGDKTSRLEVTFKKKNSECDTISIMAKEMNKWLKRESLVATALRACPILLNTTSQDNYSVILYPGDLKKRSIKRILESPLIQKCMNLKFKGGKLGKEVLNAIMNMDVEEKSVEFEETEFPLNFHHENAFKFKKVMYSDSRWVRVVDICSIQSSGKVVLGKSGFTSDDLNKLLHLWVNSEHDALDGFEIKVKMENLNREKLFDGLSTLEVIGRMRLANSPFVFISCEESETRRKPVLGIKFEKDHLGFETYQNEVKDQNAKMGEYQLLDLIKRRKELENDKTEEIREIEDVLQEEGVFFIDGKAKTELSMIVSNLIILEYFRRYAERRQQNRLNNV